MLKIMVFADFHYKKRMYKSEMSHFYSIMDRAHEENVDFVVHAGDFCNDYAGSPELISAYLNNKHDLAVYGVVGNHEIETVGNSMENVIPCLCNRDVIFAGEGLGYWYTDVCGYRLIGLDTNYSYSEERKLWEHNYPATVGTPAGNIYNCAIGPEQLVWLDATLADAKEKGIKAIVLSHAAMGGNCWQSTESAKAREIFEKHKGTVILCISGHLHTDRFSVDNNIAYFDVNATINAFWRREQEFHYSDEHTFEFQDFDAEGNLIATETMKLNDLRQGKNTWFLKDPVSAILTIDDDGTITIKGTQTEWIHGINPEVSSPYVRPMISDSQAKIEL